MGKYNMFWPYVRRQRRWGWLVVLGTAGGAVMTPLQPWPLKWLVDYVLEQRPLSKGLIAFFSNLYIAPSPASVLALAVVTTLAVFLLNSMFEALATWGWVAGGRRMVYDLTENLFTHLQRRSLTYHAQHGPGDALSRVTGDSWALYQQLDTLGVAPSRAVLTILVTLLLMSRLDTDLMLAALAMTPLALIASMWISGSIQTAARQKREIEAQIQAHLQQTLSAIPVVQAFAQETRELRRFEAYADRAIAAHQRGTLLGSLNSLGAGIVTALGTGAILWVGGHHVLEGRLALGSLLAFVFWFNLLQVEVGALARVFSTWQTVRASFDRMREVLESTPEITESRQAAKLSQARGELRFENVSAGYSPNPPVIHGINLEIPAGQFAALVGPSGAGKSTLANLVPRLLDPQQGHVMLDGLDLRKINLTSLREHVAVVTQEPFLFPWSVAENLGYARPNATRAEIEAAAKMAQAHDFICALPQSYDTVLSESGASLSGGQRQRLAMARAILKDAPVLILDEPTSALDFDTEARLFEGLRDWLARRTTLLITHRLATVRRADRIFVLFGGTLVESGTHPELIARDGHYASWLRQLAANEKEARS